MKNAVAGFTNHYNERLNKCFIAIQSTSVDKVASHVYMSLSDAYEGKQYAEYSWFNPIDSGKKYWEVAPVLCKVTMPSGQEIECKSSDEYDQLIKLHGIAVSGRLAVEEAMDARERFQKVVVPNYNRFVASPNDFSLLDNLISSMNPMAEYSGLQQLDYPPHVSRNERHRTAQAIRRQSDLMDLQKCAEVIKHVRIELSASLILCKWLMMALRRSTVYSRSWWQHYRGDTMTRNDCAGRRLGG
jgi:hypothetical protein